MAVNANCGAGRAHSHLFPLSLASLHASESIYIAITNCHRARANPNCPERPLPLWWYHGGTMDLPWYHRSIAGASFLSRCGTFHFSPPAIVNPTLPCTRCQSRSAKPNRAPSRAGGQPPALPGGSAESNGKTSRKPAPACTNPSLMQPRSATTWVPAVQVRRQSIAS